MGWGVDLVLCMRNQKEKEAVLREEFPELEHVDLGEPYHKWLFDGRSTPVRIVRVLRFALKYYSSITGIGGDYIE